MHRLYNYLAGFFFLLAVSAGDTWSGVSDLATEGIYLCSTGVQVIQEGDKTAFFKPPEPNDGTLKNFMSFARDEDFFLEDNDRNNLRKILCEKARP